MKAHLGKFAVAAAVLLGTLLPAYAATADPGRSIRSGNATRGNASARGLQRGGSRAHFEANKRVSRGNTGDLGSLLRGAQGSSAIGNALRDAYHQRERHNTAEDIADSYRDAAIASAALNALGTIIGSAIAADRPVVAAPVVAYPAPTPVPVASCPPPAPTGYWRQEQVLVREGYHAYERVWVPEHRDARGVVVEGHYEQHKKWIPAIYETRDVWVATR